MKMGHGNAKNKGMAGAATATAGHNGHALEGRRDAHLQHAMAENGAPIDSLASR
jgi:hypothetical protein